MIVMIVYINICDGMFMARVSFIKADLRLNSNNNNTGETNQCAGDILESNNSGV